jgi:hypothetical protein
MQSVKLIKANFKLPVKLQILMRNNLNLLNYPVGVDIDGNMYFDDGLNRFFLYIKISFKLSYLNTCLSKGIIRKVIKQDSPSLYPVTVLDEYSSKHSFCCFIKTGWILLLIY